MPDTPERGARVVIVAQEPMVARILAHKLRREGHDITTVHDGAALDAAPIADVVLLDMRLRDAAPPARVGWFAIVDGRDGAAAHAAMQQGAAGLVRTPFKPTEVAAQVAALLAMVSA